MEKYISLLSILMDVMFGSWVSSKESHVKPGCLAK